MTKPVRVVESAATTAGDRIEGRILENLGDDQSGNRTYRVRIIAYGDSGNHRRYPESVLRAAVPKYENARVFDGHRSDAQLRSSGLSGMLGWIDDVSAQEDGLHGKMHMFTSARHAIEAIDSTLAAQESGGAPLCGLSHDVQAQFRMVRDGGRRLQEAQQIMRVNSADLVCEPAAGGAVRAVAGGTGDTETEELHDLATARGRQVAAREAQARGLPENAVDKVISGLPAQFSEADLNRAITGAWAEIATSERSGLTPAVQVGQESRDRKVKGLDAFFAQSGGGYRSLREAYLDYTGTKVDYLGEDLNRRIMADSIGRGYDSALRSAESLDSTSWAQVLGDSVTRQMIAEYRVPNLMVWRNVVSSVAFGVDFRTQRRPRVGGYGILPAVNESAPYPALTSPTDEEATYALSKRGGTDDLTLEMIANDDVRAIAGIPRKLGRAAAVTLYRFVFDFFVDNSATTYDSTALFHNDHANTASSAALSQTTLITARQSMRSQARYGDSDDLLSVIPRWLVVPNELEEIAFQLTESETAIPATSNDPSDRPNLNRGVDPIVIDYYTDANDWFLVCDPSMSPTFEIGFYTNSDQPELFTQADPNSGTMFNADKQTFKVRHIYSGTVLDHRGMYRGQG